MTFKGDLRSKPFIQIIVGVWNELPETMVEAVVEMLLKRYLEGT